MVEELTKGEGYLNFEGVENWPSQVDDILPNLRNTPAQRSNIPHWKGMFVNTDEREEHPDWWLNSKALK